MKRQGYKLLLFRYCPLTAPIPRSCGQFRHSTSSEQVHMEMENGLSTIGTTVDDQPVSTSVDPNFPRDPVCRSSEQAHYSGSVAAEIGDRFDMRSRYDQYMHRGRGVYIPEGHDVFVFVDEFGRQRTLGDTAE